MAAALAVLRPAGCAWAADVPQPPAKTSLPLQAEVKTVSGIRIVAMRNGWVQVKRQHRELTIPRLLAVPGIFLGNQWVNWMPIISYAIVHPEGTILVDTGPPANVNTEDYYSCDKFNEVFYRRNCALRSRLQKH